MVFVKQKGSTQRKTFFVNSDLLHASVPTANNVEVIVVSSNFLLCVLYHRISCIVLGHVSSRYVFWSSLLSSSPSDPTFCVRFELCWSGRLESLRDNGRGATLRRSLQALNSTPPASQDTHTPLVLNTASSSALPIAGGLQLRYRS